MPSLHTFQVIVGDKEYKIDALNIDHAAELAFKRRGVEIYGKSNDENQGKAKERASPKDEKFDWRDIQW